MTVNMLPTTKFKTNRLQIAFSNDLRKETSTARALLPYLLKATTTKFPTRQLLQTHLENLYSAGFGASIRKVGLTQIITFDLSLINNQYTLEEIDLFHQGLQFFKEVLFHPHFTNEIFLEEKRLLMEYFDSIYADKMRYAVKQAIHEMYKGEAFDVDAHGEQELLEHLTLHDVVQAYQDMLTTDHISVNIVGDIDPVNIIDKIKSTFPFAPRKKQLNLFDKSPKPHRPVQEIFESQDIQQGKLVLGYQLPVYYLEEDYHRAVVFNSLLGSGPDSLLFKRIREELSLVYFIGSIYDYLKGSMLFYAGINQSAYTQVVTEIDKTIQDIIDQNYPETQLHIAKNNIISSLKQSFDQQGSLVARIYNTALFQESFDLEKRIDLIQNVTKEDLKNIALKLRKDICYLLRNDQLENNTL
jgi:predicted Zn-dependent peptidase